MAEGDRSPRRQADFGTLTRVAIKEVRAAFESAEAIRGQWAALRFTAAPDFDRAVAEGETFVSLLAERGISVERMPAFAGTGMDSLYVRDATVLTDRGAILCRMGKRARSGEPLAQAAFLESLRVPVLGAIEEPGTLEGGDVAWLGPRTVAVGHGYRTNAEGIRQLESMLGLAVDEVLVVALPHYRGPEDVFHLMSILSPLGPDLALVFSPLMPVPFRRELLARGFRLVEVPDEEFETLGCNCLAIDPQTCLLAAGNPKTRRRLEAAGIEVLEYSGREISIKGGGGPTCLTRPLEWS